MKMTRAGFLRGVWTAAVVMSFPLGAAEPGLRVAAAASLADALKEIDAAFSRDSGAKVELNLGASSTLARQIEAGAPADVFFSADLAKMDALAAKGLIRAATRRNRLSNTLVVVVPADSALPFTSDEELAGPRVGKIATGDPRAVPVGVYARAYLEKRGLWELVAPKIVATENVRAALAAVESGNVEAGIVYKTDAALSKKVKMAFEIPAAIGPRIVYPVAVLTAALQPELAGRYLDFLDTSAATAVFEKFGFIIIPPTEAAPAAPAADVDR